MPTKGDLYLPYGIRWTIPLIPLNESCSFVQDITKQASALGKMHAVTVCGH